MNRPPLRWLLLVVGATGCGQIIPLGDEPSPRDATADPADTAADTVADTTVDTTADTGVDATTTDTGGEGLTETSLLPDSATGASPDAPLDALDAGADAGSSDAPDSGTDAGPPPLFLLWHSATNAQVGVATMSSDGIITPGSATASATAWTHVAPLAPNRAVFYDAVTGARALGTVDRTQRTVSLAPLSADLGWKAVASLPPDQVLWYASTDSSARVRIDKVDVAGFTRVAEPVITDPGFFALSVVTSTPSGWVFMYSAGGRFWSGEWKDGALSGASGGGMTANWTHLRSYRSQNIIYYMAKNADPSLLGAMAVINFGATPGRQVGTWPSPPWDGADRDFDEVVGAGKYLLFYRAKDGRTRLATVEIDENLEPQWREVPMRSPVSLPKNWKHIVSLD